MDGRRTNNEHVEIRESADGATTITGYASVYYRSDDPGTEFDIGTNIKERIMPGAFNQALENGDDVRALFNHNESQILGRLSAGTLRLSTNRRGLLYEIDLPPTTLGRDLQASVARGDVTGSSFAFRVLEDAWRTVGGVDVREIRNVSLVDVGPVTYPAYKSTSAAMRDDAFFAECRSAHEDYCRRKVHEQRMLELRLKAAQL